MVTRRTNGGVEGCHGLEGRAVLSLEIIVLYESFFKIFCLKSGNSNIFIQHLLEIHDLIQV